MCEATRQTQGCFDVSDWTLTTALTPARPGVSHLLGAACTFFCSVCLTTSQRLPLSPIDSTPQRPPPNSSSSSNISTVDLLRAARGLTSTAAKLRWFEARKASPQPDSVASPIHTSQLLRLQPSCASPSSHCSSFRSLPSPASHTPDKPPTGPLPPPAEACSSAAPFLPPSPLLALHCPSSRRLRSKS